MIAKLRKIREAIREMRSKHVPSTTPEMEARPYTGTPAPELPTPSPQSFGTWLDEREGLPDLPYACVARARAGRSLGDDIRQTLGRQPAYAKAREQED